MPEPKITSSADGQRAPNDPTTDPYHTRGMDPRAAEAGFREAGFPEKGPLAGRDIGDEVALDKAVGDVAVAPAPDGQPNPTQDDNPPEGGVIREDQIVSSPPPAGADKPAREVRSGDRASGKDRA